MIYMQAYSYNYRSHRNHIQLILLCPDKHNKSVIIIISIVMYIQCTSYENYYVY